MLDFLILALLCYGGFHALGALNRLTYPPRHRAPRTTR